MTTPVPVKYPEFIYALDSGVDKALNLQEGFTPSIAYDAFWAAVQPHVYMAQRDQLEKNPNFRQFLPYMIISRIRAGVKEYLVYKRAKGAGESRLIGNASIGIGGHVDANDTVLDSNSVLHFQQVIQMAHTRELFEECRFRASTETNEEDFKSLDDLDATQGIRLASYLASHTAIHGYLNEYSTQLVKDALPVGLVHFGYVMEISLGDQIDATVREEAMEMVGWMTADQLAVSVLPFENWSKLLIENLSNLRGVPNDAEVEDGEIIADLNQQMNQHLTDGGSCYPSLDA